MIGGNTCLQLYVKSGGFTLNSIGEKVPATEKYIDLWGFLDMSTSDTKHTTFNAKIQESDYLFICDYMELPKYNDVIPTTNQLTAKCNGKEYDVLLIDNVMNLNEHYEIYLRYKGE